MHGLIFKTSIYYRQDQPGSYHLSRTSRRKLTPSYAHTTTCMHRQSRPRLSAHLECCCSKALNAPGVSQKNGSPICTHTEMHGQYGHATLHGSPICDCSTDLPETPKAPELPSSVRPQAYFLLTQSALISHLLWLSKKKD